MNMSAEISDPSAGLTPEQDKLLGQLLNRALNASQLLQYETTAELFEQRFHEELENDIGMLKQVYPAGGVKCDENFADIVHCWGRALRSCPKPVLDSQVIGRMYRTLYGEAGRFAPYIESTTFRATPEEGKLLAAVYNLIMNEPERYQPWLDKISNPVARIVMGQGDGFEAFVKELQGLQKTFGGETHIDALAEITKQALEDMDDHPEVLRKLGGVQALADAGVDIHELQAKLQHTIYINAHTPSRFSESYHLIVEAIEHLHQAEDFTDEDRMYQLRDLAMTCFDELDRTHGQKWFDRSFWAKVLPDMAKTLPRENFNSRRMLNLIKYSDPDPVWLEQVKLADNFQPEFFKIEMKKAYPPEGLYDAVSKLKALHVYSENERLQLLGNRFSQDLGL